MSDRKYIILQNDETGKEYAVIFDHDLSHQAVANGIVREMARNEWGPHMWLEPVAAGFVSDPSRGSESLKLGPRPQDHDIIQGERRHPLIVSAADGPLAAPKPRLPPPTRSLLDRARGGKVRL